MSKYYRDHYSATRVPPRSTPRPPLLSGTHHSAQRPAGLHQRPLQQPRYPVQQRTAPSVRREPRPQPRNNLKITTEVNDVHKQNQVRSNVFSRLGKPIGRTADGGKEQTTKTPSHDKAYRSHLEKLKRVKQKPSIAKQESKETSSAAPTRINDTETSNTNKATSEKDISRLSHYLIHMKSLKPTRKAGAFVSDDRISESAKPQVVDNHDTESMDVDVGPGDHEFSTSSEANANAPQTTEFDAVETVPPPATAPAPAVPFIAPVSPERKNIFEKMEGDMLASSSRPDTASGVKGAVAVELSKADDTGDCAGVADGNAEESAVLVNDVKLLTSSNRHVEQEESNGSRHLLITTHFDVDSSTSASTPADQDEIPIENRSKKEDNLWFCDVCSKQVREEKIIHLRGREHKSNKKWNRPHCKVCDMYFNRPRQLIQHTKTEAHKEKQKENRLSDESSKKQEEMTIEAKVLSEPGATDSTKQTEVAETNDAEPAESSSDGPSAKDIPHIIPVAGFYCELCCDFFFDEASTLVHCESNEHVEKVPSKTKSPPLKEEPDEEPDSVDITPQSKSNRRRRRRKNNAPPTPTSCAKQARTEATKHSSLAMVNSDVSVDLTVDETLVAPAETPERTARNKKTKRTARKSAPSSLVCDSDGVGNPKWRFVIPKKKQFM